FAPFGEFSGQLDTSGENIALVDAQGDTVISFRYDDKIPWPEAADGDGYSLVWTNAVANGDPAEPGNWAASSILHGTPGASDPALAVAQGLTGTHPFNLFPNFPNPFYPVTTIRFDLQQSGFVKLEIFDVLGRHVITLAEKSLPAGRHEFEWNARDYAAGLYFYRLETDRHVQIRKALIVK
ncbi:MAG: T9SS C-terminal target domain-containing protein, partial [Calditrichaeota bacterium]